MPDVKITCPHCRQHLWVDSAWGGMQVNCPGCNGGMIVPGAPPPAPAQAPPDPIPAPFLDPAGFRTECPNCYAPLPRGGVICKRCGYNQATGRQILPPREPVEQSVTVVTLKGPWYPYAAAAFVVAGISIWVAFANPDTYKSILGAAFVYYLAVSFVVLYAAFREGEGIQAIFVPFYKVYFVLTADVPQLLRILYLSGMALVFLLALAGAIAKQMHMAHP